MKTIINKKVSGSYTIELSLIMPILLGIIILCIYMLLYVHDIAVMEYAVTRACIQYDFYNSNYVETDVEDCIKNEISKSCIGKWNSSINIDADYDEIVVSVQGVMIHSQGLVDNLVWKKPFTISVSRMKKLRNNIYEY